MWEVCGTTLKLKGQILHTQLLPSPLEFPCLLLSVKGGAEMILIV